MFLPNYDHRYYTHHFANYVTLALLMIMAAYYLIQTLQLFSQLEEPMLKPLRQSLTHYEQLKMLDDVKKEEGRQQRWQTSGGRST